MKNKPISKDLLDRYVMYLNGLKSGVKRQELHKKYNIPYWAFSLSKKLNYIQVVNKHVVFILENIEPIHARKLILAVRNAHSEAQIKKRKPKIKIIEQSNPEPINVIKNKKISEEQIDSVLKSFDILGNVKFASRKDMIKAVGNLSDYLESSKRNKVSVN